MLGVPIRYLLRHPLAAVELASDPVGLVSRARDIYIAQREQRKPQCSYEPNPSWERWLHLQLGVPWPCPLAGEFQELWAHVIAELRTQQIEPGPQSFGSWNDGDAGFVRAVWCAVRHTRPAQVVETGVAHGVTSRLILEALKANRAGQLWSIDVPPLEDFLRRRVGIAVGNRHRDRWTYIKGSSRRRLPNLLTRLGSIGIFVHDSLHSEHNLRFELDRTWRVLTSGGIMVVDDIDANWGFKSFRDRFSGLQSTVCEAEPLRPDLRRFNRKGLFGIIVKPQSGDGLALDRLAG